MHQVQIRVSVWIGPPERKDRKWETLIIFPRTETILELLTTIVPELLSEAGHANGRLHSNTIVSSHYIPWIERGDAHSTSEFSITCPTALISPIPLHILIFLAIDVLDMNHVAELAFRLSFISELWLASSTLTLRHRYGSQALFLCVKIQR